MRLQVRSLPLLSGLRIRRCPELCVGCRRGSDPALLWLWCRLVATAPIQPLAWEPPYAAGAAQEIATTTKDKKTKRQKKKKESYLKDKFSGPVPDKRIRNSRDRVE